MVKLQLSSSSASCSWSSSSPIPANIQAKLPIQGLPHSYPKLPFKSPSSSFPPSLFVFNPQQPQYHTPLFPPINQSVAAIVFGDGSESRLYPLTKRRSSGAIPIAANYRLIDAVVSNCINSNINKIYAFTQFNSTSLNSHLAKAYNGVGLGKEGFVEVIAAYQSPEDQGWFQGTADAMRRCLWVLEEYPVTEFLILPGHHLYKMDYQKLIEAHRSSKADITVVALNSTRDQDPGLGLFKLNSKSQAIELNFKSERKVADSKQSNDIDHTYNPSMGIYLIQKDTMTELLAHHFPRANDFGSEVISGAISIGMKVQAYLFDGYWEDMRSIEAFYQANMQCIKKSNNGYNFYDRDSPVYTMPRCLPPTVVKDAVITESVIGNGSILSSCKIKGSVVGLRTRIGERAIIEDSVIMGSDIYQNEDFENAATVNRKGLEIPIGIGEDTQIKKAIIDKNARIGKNVLIINKDQVQEGAREANGYIISGGIVVVLRGAMIPDGSVL